MYFSPKLFPLHRNRIKKKIPINKSNTFNHRKITTEARKCEPTREHSITQTFNSSHRLANPPSAQWAAGLQETPCYTPTTPNPKESRTHTLKKKERKISPQKSFFRGQ